MSSMLSWLSERFPTLPKDPIVAFKQCISYSFTDKKGWCDDNGIQYREIDMVILGGLSGTMEQTKTLTIPLMIECVECGWRNGVIGCKESGEWSCPACEF
jgi:hypothetical protein